MLDAIRIGLWSFVGGFDLARNPGNEAGNKINIDDVRIERIKHESTIHHDQAVYDDMKRLLPCEISLQADFEGALGAEKFFKTQPWKRFRNSEAKSSITKDDVFSSLVKRLASIAQDQVRNSDSPDIDLPVLGYYGTGRLWSQKRLTEKKKKHDASFYMRLFGYRDCLDPSSSYKHFADWFTWIFECYWENKFKQSENGLSSEMDSVWSNTIQVVQQAIDSVLQETGWHSLEYSVSHEKSLVLKHDEHGTLKVESLSDGIRGVLAMVGDIAYRCIKLNPHLGLNAAKESSGVVMIDEVDMHLHPSWQQTILGNLLYSLSRKSNLLSLRIVHRLFQQYQGIKLEYWMVIRFIQADEGTQGAEASRILKEVFGVEPRAQNLEIVQKLNRYLELIDNDQWDTPEALTLRQTLDEWSRGNEPELVKADIDIRMKEFQRQL